MVFAHVFECVDLLVATFEHDLSLCGSKDEEAERVCAFEFDFE